MRKVHLNLLERPQEEFTLVRFDFSYLGSTYHETYPYSIFFKTMSCHSMRVVREQEVTILGSITDVEDLEESFFDTFSYEPVEGRRFPYTFDVVNHLLADSNAYNLSVTRDQLARWELVKSWEIDNYLRYHLDLLNSQVNNLKMLREKELGGSEL